MRLPPEPGNSKRSLKSNGSCGGAKARTSDTIILEFAMPEPRLGKSIQPQIWKGPSATLRTKWRARGPSDEGKGVGRVLEAEFCLRGGVNSASACPSHSPAAHAQTTGPHPLHKASRSPHDATQLESIRGVNDGYVLERCGEEECRCLVLCYHMWPPSATAWYEIDWLALLRDATMERTGKTSTS